MNHLQSINHSTSDTLSTAEKVQHVEYVITTLSDGELTTFAHPQDIRAGQYLISNGSIALVVEDGTPSSAMPGLVCVETNIGPVYLDPDCEYEILAVA